MLVTSEMRFLSSSCLRHPYGHLADLQLSWTQLLSFMSALALLPLADEDLDILWLDIPALSNDGS